MPRAVLGHWEEMPQNETQRVNCVEGGWVKDVGVWKVGTQARGGVQTATAEVPKDPGHDSPEGIWVSCQVPQEDTQELEAR